MKNYNNNFLVTPIETGNLSLFGPIQPRGYGFKQDGKTDGGAMENGDRFILLYKKTESHILKITNAK